MFSITQLIEPLTTELTSADVISITSDAALADVKTIRWMIEPTVISMVMPYNRRSG